MVLGTIATILLGGVFICIGLGFIVGAFKK